MELWSQAVSEQHRRVERAGTGEAVPHVGLTPTPAVSLGVPTHHHEPHFPHLQNGAVVRTEISP